MLTSVRPYLRAVPLLVAVLIFTLVNDMDNKVAYFAVSTVVIVVVTLGMERVKRRPDA